MPTSSQRTGLTPSSLPNMSPESQRESASLNRGILPLRSRRLGNVLTKSFLGRFTSKVNGAAHTTAIQFGLEAHFDAVRLIIPNSVTADIAGVTAKISSGGSAAAAGASGAVAPVDGAWKTVTFAGANNVTLPAGTSADRPSFTVSDWVECASLARTDGGIQPLLWARVHIPAAAANRPAWFYPGLTNWENEALVAGRIVRCRTQAVDGVSTLGNFTTAGSASDYECVPIIIQYASRVNGLTIMVVGDSIDEKGGASHRYGWQDITQAAVSSLERPVEIATLAIGGSNSTAWRQRLSDSIDVIAPDFVCVPDYGVNDVAAPLTQAQINLMRRNAAESRTICRSKGAIPIRRTGLPTNPTGTFPKDLGATDSLRRALNDALRADKLSLILDFDRDVAGDIDADGQVLFAEGMSDDALHMSTIAHQRVAASRGVPLFRQLVAANLTW